MPKDDSKKDEQILDTLLPDIEDMSREDAEELLGATGVDLRALRMRLRDTAKGIAADLRKKGTPAPRYLTRAIETLDDTEKLPASSDAAALAKAKDVIRRFRTPQPVPKDAKLLRAARVSPAANADDDDAAEKLAEDLRQEIEKDDPPPK
jgi:phage-related tail protein